MTLRHLAVDLRATGVTTIGVLLTKLNLDSIDHLVTVVTHFIGLAVVCFTAFWWCLKIRRWWKTGKLD